MKKKQNFNKQLLGGMIAFVVFLIIFLVTNSIVERNNRTFAELSSKEKVDYINKIVTFTDNENYFSYAVFAEDRTYCDFITNSSLKKECYKYATEYKEQPFYPEMSAQEMEDETAFQAALFSENKTVCNNILNEDKKNSCITLLS